MDDEKILDLFFQRDEQAVSLTQMKYGSYCQSIAYRILRQKEDGDECVNDTWLRTWSSIPPARPENLRAYVGKITRNLALNRIRKDSAWKRTGDCVSISLNELSECIADQGNVEEQIENNAVAEGINRFLAELPKEKRVCFVLRYWYFYSIAEIAEKMHMREEKAKSILFRTRKQLKHYLEQEDIL